MIRLVAFAAALLSAGAAQAHTVGAHGAGFIAGFAHPFGGLDHLLAMIAVGLWAAQLGGRALWVVPAAFAGTMALGGIVGLAGYELSGFEQVVAASVLVLGMVIALALRMRTDLAAMLVGAFAVCHGLAHGAELPASAAPLGYVVGFILATALLHGVGCGLGLLSARTGRTDRIGRRAVRTAGAAIAVAGVYLVTPFI